MITFPLLTPDDAARLLDVAKTLDFANGAETAAGAARSVKRNKQARFELGGAEEKLIVTALDECNVFRYHALPHRVTRPLVNRYDEVDEYGWHMDAAIMGREAVIRIDYSMTIFLNHSFAGGVLEMGSDATAEPKAGWAALYPATELHRVTSVHGGSRYAVVVWIQSQVRDEARRDVLRGLQEATLRHADDLNLARVRSNLHRLWVEL